MPIVVSGLIYAALIADGALAESGLPIFSPISSLISIVGTWLLIAIAVAVIAYQCAKHVEVSVVQLLMLMLGLVASGWIAYMGIVSFASPIAISKAKNTLDIALRTASLLDFDERILPEERSRVSNSSSTNWTLHFASPMFTGFDFVLNQDESRPLGARVRPSTTWRRRDKVWVFPEPESMPKAP